MQRLLSSKSFPIHHSLHHHHHMALEPNSGPGLPFLGFRNNNLLWGWIVSAAPNSQPGGPGLRIFDPRRRGGSAIPQALGSHFSRLLRHAWVTVGLSFNPGHHMGASFTYYRILRLYIILVTEKNRNI
jgi:hypothetical protein